MSDTEGFMDEVAEEVRKDKLFGYLRRYGWIAALVVIALVGGTAYNEWSKSQTQAAAQARGDALLDAIELTEPEARADAFDTLIANGEDNPVARLLAASQFADAGREDEAAALYRAMAAEPELETLYKDLAVLKSAALATQADVEQTRAALASISAPGAPYRLLAEEQLAVLEAQAGDVEAAITRLQAIMVDFEASQGLQTRALQLIVALGGTPELANTPLAATNN